MRSFFCFSLTYSLVVAFVASISLDLDLTAFRLALAKSVALFLGLTSSVSYYAPALVIAALLSAFIGNRRASVSNLVYSVSGVILLQISFSFAKASIPEIVPFYADAALADFDEWLHAGIAPWLIIHSISAEIDISMLLPAYFQAWILPAVGLPIILAVFDRDPGRVRRFLILYLVSWVFVGNIVALAGSSVGPVFYDQVYGTTRFEQMRLALQTSGIAQTVIGRTQEVLLDSYVSGNLVFGSGISAFPSVHVSTTTCFSFYLMERSRWLAVPAILFLAVVLFISILSGYHYAVDGYFSILIVGFVWAALRHGNKIASLRARSLRWGVRSHRTVNAASGNEVAMAPN